MPKPVIPFPYRSTSNIAHIMYQKYVNAVPLYRQEQIGKIQDKAKPCNDGELNHMEFDELLKPLGEWMHKTILEKISACRWKL